jgi:Ca2+-binding EF-hand superfamily protein
MFKEWFSKLDRDGDGKIDMIEMAHSMEKLKSKIS